MWLAFSIAAGIIAAMITFAVLSRINGNIEETDEVEPIGDMVDMKNILNKYEDGVMMNSSETFELQVQSVTWGGFHSEYIYKLTAEQAESIKALKDAKKFCGDFESINHVAITKIKTEVRKHLINEFGEFK